MQRWQKFLLILATVIAVGGAIGAGVSAWISEALRQEVAGQLQTLVGGPVQVGSVHVGPHGSSIENLELRVPGADSHEAPWLRAKAAHADISLDDAHQGRWLPHQLTLRGVEVALRLDRAGHLLTPLPRQGSADGSSLPAIRLEEGQLTIHQEGRPEMVIHGIAGSIDHGSEGLTVQGKIEDAVWGHWNLKGDADVAHGEATLTLRCAGVHVTPAMLERLPGVPAGSWKAVRLEGDTAAEATLNMELPKQRIDWRMVLTPHDTSLEVTAIDLRVQQVHGQVKIEDRLIQLQSMEGRTADGVIHADSTLDFRKTPAVLQFRIGVKGVHLRELPARWSLPTQVDGRLQGHADLQISMQPGKVATTGSGEGVIDPARLAGLPVQPIPLQLRTTPHGLRFAAGATGASPR